MTERDPMLRRFERNMAVATAVMATVAMVLGRLDIGAGVVGGAALMAAGYWTIKSLVNVLTPRAIMPRPARRTKAGPWFVIKIAGRYALLGLAAYVMLVSLSMHPIGLLLGASVPFVAASLELAFTHGETRTQSADRRVGQ